MEAVFNIPETYFFKQTITCNDSYMTVFKYQHFITRQTELKDGNFILFGGSGANH